jgi:hypothetical protein
MALYISGGRLGDACLGSRNLARSAWRAQAPPADRTDSENQDRPEEMSVERRTGEPKVVEDALLD